jgi:hypothetical protein
VEEKGIHFCWIITFDLSGMGDPTSRYATAGIALRIFFILSGMRLSPFGTAATTGLLYQPQMMMMMMVVEQLVE